MVGISSTSSGGQIASPLAQGLNIVDQEQEVNFVLYNRRVLTLDGSVFWVNSSVTNESGISTSFNARGSLHKTTINSQSPDESMSVHRMVFTSLTEVDQLSAIEPDTLWMGQTDDQQYAFSTRSGWYKQAALYHYSGDAVYPPFASQIINTLEELDLTDVILSNSMPIWLALTGVPFPIYPSYLVPDNAIPPYASVHIGEDDTTPLTAGATHDGNGSRFQLARDRVRITTFGVRNNGIFDFIDLVQAYALANAVYNSDSTLVMGIMNSPVPGDAKRGQVEISSLAQKKVTEFHVNYYQQRLNTITRKIILKAVFGPIFVSG